MLQNLTNLRATPNPSHNSYAHSTPIEKGAGFGKALRESHADAANKSRSIDQSDDDPELNVTSDDLDLAEVRSDANDPLSAMIEKTELGQGAGIKIHPDDLLTGLDDINIASSQDAALVAQGNVLAHSSKMVEADTTGANGTLLQHANATMGMAGISVEGISSQATLKAPLASMATNEQVASKPIPCTSSAEISG